jgi:hypothetical protein
MEPKVPNNAAIGQSRRSLAKVKLRFTAQALRWLSVAYAGWVLWQILNWWLRPERVARELGSYWQRDLSGMAAWQPLGAMGLDLLAWALLLAAVVQCWNLLGQLRSSTGFTVEGATQLMRCAWLASACEAAALLFRPVQSWLITLHLPVDARLFQWQFRSADLQAIVFCATLLMFALVYLWALEIAEENKGFV